MERLGPDIRVSCNAIALPNLGDQLWYIANNVDEKERMYGTILLALYCYADVGDSVRL